MTNKKKTTKKSVVKKSTIKKIKKTIAKPKKRHKKVPACRRPWSSDLKAYIIASLASMKKHKEIWDDVMDPEFEELTSIEPPHEKAVYRTFVERCKALDPDVVRDAHETWKTSFDDIYFATQKGRIESLVKLINTLNDKIEAEDFDKDTTGTMVAMVGQIRAIYEQIKKEQSADADRAAIASSGVKVLIANPKQIDLDADLISELILTMRHDLGGITKLFQFDILEIHELEKLKTNIDVIIENKIDGMMETEIIEEDEDEDRNSK